MLQQILDAVTDKRKCLSFDNDRTTEFLHLCDQERALQYEIAGRATTEQKIEVLRAIAEHGTKAQIEAAPAVYVGPDTHSDAHLFVVASKTTGDLRTVKVFRNFETCVDCPSSGKCHHRTKARALYNALDLAPLIQIDNMTDSAMDADEAREVNYFEHFESMPQRS